MTRRCADGSSEFVCPLWRACLAAQAEPFADYAACNAAVLRARTLLDSGARAEAVDQLFQNLLPLVRKTLRRFCSPVFRGSRCEAGACYPEELIGESYLGLREAIEEWDPARGVDFLGYAGRALYWRLEHAARRLRRASSETIAGAAGDDWLDTIPAAGADEDDLLTRTLAAELLSGLDPADAELATLAAEGYNSRELAQRAGSSESAVRKRLQRIRERLRRPVS